MHIKQPKILLASAMHKHAYIQYHMHSTASTHIHLLPKLIHQLVSMHSQPFKYAHQTATNTVGICIAQTWLHTISHAFHSLNLYSLTNLSHSSIGQPMHSQSLKYAHQSTTNTVRIVALHIYSNINSLKHDAG
jgi:hypothetical protein